jgi:hypothetical protein
MVFQKIPLSLSTIASHKQLLDETANSPSRGHFIAQLFLVAQHLSIVGYVTGSVGVQQHLDADVPISSTLEKAAYKERETATADICTPTDPSGQCGDHIQIISNSSTP